MYRFYDAADALLYVGISRNLVARWAQHEVEKTWWSAVARKTVTMYGSRREAELAEGHAIRSESPLHNKAMGRRDEAEPKPKPKRPAPRPPAPKQPTNVPWRRGPRTFEPDADFAASIDAFAEQRQVSRADAIGQLVFTGLTRMHQLANGTLEDLDAELAAMAAYQETRQAARRRLAFAPRS